jgi:hypothetical protein
MAQRTFTINLADGYYTATATGKRHLMKAAHAERIIAARNSRPAYAQEGEAEHDFDAYTAYLNSPEYKRYERNYRAALAESRVLCIQRQTRVYATPSNERVSDDASNLPADLCVKCASHLG